MKLFCVHWLVHALAHTSNFKFSSSEYLSLSSECESYAMRRVWILYFSFSTFIWIRVNVYLLIDVVGTSFSLSRSIYEVTAGWFVGWLVRYGVRCTLLIAISPWLFARTPYTSITNWNTNFENLSFSTLTILRKKGQIYLKNEKRRRKHQQQQPQ